MAQTQHAEFVKLVDFFVYNSATLLDFKTKAQIYEDDDFFIFFFNPAKRFMASQFSWLGKNLLWRDA